MQVAVNLIVNAADAISDRNAGVGCITVRCGVHEAGLFFDVEDDGRGIAIEHRGRIFDLFFTTKQRGSGLGLPLTQQIVVAHGGQIRCESAPGQGTEFTLFFPAARATERAGDESEVMVAED